MKVKCSTTAEGKCNVQNAGAETPQVRRLRELEKRNRGLKRMLAASLLKKRALKIVNAKKQ